MLFVSCLVAAASDILAEYRLILCVFSIVLQFVRKSGCKAGKSVLLEGCSGRETSGYVSFGDYNLIEDETDTILRYSFVVFRNNVGRTA